MNWKLKALLLYDKVNPSLQHSDAVPIEAQRAHAEKISALGTKIFNAVLSVQSIWNLEADGIPVRIYANSSEPAQPVIVYYHGGGFALYSLDSHDAVCRRLCVMNNAIVVSVDYRMAPEYTFPVAHQDAWTALQWVKKNISTYHGDPSKIILAGDSAGGNLSACMAIKAKRENLKLLAQVLVYPWVDGRIISGSVERNGKGYFLTKESILWFQQKYTPDPKDHCNPLVSPLFETEVAGLAPAFIITAEFDPLLDEGKAYADKLSEAGNEVQYKEYKGLVHGFFNIPGIDAEAMQAYKDIRDFVQRLV